jgi:hypothetical protein
VTPAVAVWLLVPELDFGTVLGWLHAIELPEAAELETDGRSVVLDAAEFMR